MTQKVRYQKLDSRAVEPKYGSADAAGADLYAIMDAPLTLKPGQTALVHTGLAVEIPAGFVGLVCARSGLATKRGLAPANKVGVIDADYRGEVMVALHNHSAEAQTIDQGERVAQLVLVPYLTAAYEQAEDLSDTDRGAGGFGSTGTK
ncbi:MAG: dUTP diphosphatase [Ruminococcaceae bacterium]|nr:dUTP diphosphatase [Oscillospiraceae bacterium]